jgi:ferredoxin
LSERRIAIVYFSATQVTHTYVESIQEALQDRGCEVSLFNVTSHASRQAPLPVDEYDGFVFGFPVFGDFAPSVVNAWLPTLDGQGRSCAQFFTYGARTTGYAHFHTKLLLEQANFRVLCSAEFLGRHSFNVGGWRVLLNRPKEQDFSVARTYADMIFERFSQEAPPILRLQKPFGYPRAIAALEEREASGERDWTHPVRVTDTCQLCRRCEHECPSQAFDADTGLSDPENCISCMHCVYICPDDVLKIDERMKEAYEDFLSFWHLTEDMMRAKKSKIITEAWQAAF